MRVHQRSHIGSFLAALLPSRAAVMRYLRLIGWLIVVYLIDVYVERNVGSVVLRVIVNLSVIYLTLSILYDTIALGLIFFYRKKNNHPDQHVDSFTLGILRLSRALFVFTFILFVIDIFVPIRTFIGSLTIAMALIGLALRDFITNFVNGLTIMFTSPFQLGEYIRVGELKGKIRDMTFMHVHLQTESQDIVFVPNNVILSKEVINYSKNKVKKVLVRMVIDRSMFGQYEAFRSFLLHEIPKKFDDHLTRDNMVVRVDAIEKDAVVWLVEYHVSKYSFELETELKDYTAGLLVAFNTKEVDV